MIYVILYYGFRKVLGEVDLKLILILQIGKHFKGIIQSLNKLYWLGLLLAFFPESCDIRKYI